MAVKVAIAMNMLAHYWVEVFERLSAKGWELKIFIGIERGLTCRHDPDSPKNSTFEVKKNGDYLPGTGRFHSKSGYLHLKYGLWSDLCAWEPHLIVSTELGVRTLISLLYGTIFDIPVIPWVSVSKHTERNNGPLGELFRKQVLRGVPCVCTNLTEAREYLMDNLKVPRYKIFHTPYAVNVAAYNANVMKARERSQQLKMELGLRDFVFLYVGRMIARKGIRELIEGVLALDDVSLRKASFLFVGGHLPEKLISALEERNVRFTNVPFVQPKELPHYYAVADAFVFPSLEDEWGIVLNEAAASGLPIISSSYAAAARDLIREGCNGLIINPRDKQQTAGVLKTVLDMPSEHLMEWGRISLLTAKMHDMVFTVNNLNSALLFAHGKGHRATHGYRA